MMMMTTSMTRLSETVGILTAKSQGVATFCALEGTDNDVGRQQIRALRRIEVQIMSDVASFTVNGMLLCCWCLKLESDCRLRLGRGRQNGLMGTNIQKVDYGGHVRAYEGRVPRVGYASAENALLESHQTGLMPCLLLLLFARRSSPCHRPLSSR